jgi:hypothetical protein
MELTMRQKSAVTNKLDRSYRGAGNPADDRGNRRIALQPHHVPEVDADQLEANEPGHYQFDLVSHDGCNARGEFAYSVPHFASEFLPSFGSGPAADKRRP